MDSRMGTIRHPIKFPLDFGSAPEDQQRLSLQHEEIIIQQLETLDEIINLHGYYSQ